MKNLSGLILVLGLTLALPAVAQAAEQAAQSQDGGEKPATASIPLAPQLIHRRSPRYSPASPVRTIARHGPHTSIIPAAATDLFPL